MTHKRLSATLRDHVVCKCLLRARVRGAVIQRNFKSAAAVEPEAQAATLHARPKLGVDCVAPRNETEQTIADIWQELLGIEPIGVHGNFFELGGESLLPTQVVARVRTALKTELPLRHFFEESTVA